MSEAIHEVTRGINWGRWGEDDQRGALNRITAEVTLRALQSVRTGQVLSLAIPLSSAGPVAGMRSKPQHYMTRDGGDYCAGLKEKGFGYADDVIMLPTHGTTHMDALAHVWAEGKMWNGYSCTAVTSKGARKCSIETAGPIVTRGILVDFARPGGVAQDDSRAITLAELQDEIHRIQVQPRSGDALVIRTGWMKRLREGKATESQWSGLAPECAQWIDEQGFAVVAADNMAVEFGPSPLPCNAAPMHVELMRNRGVVFMELLDLESLAVSGRHEFMLVVSPLPIVGGVGSPVNPVAIL